VNTKATNILLSICVALAGWNLKETISLGRQVAVIQKVQDLQQELAIKVSMLEQWRYEHEGRTAVLLDEFRRLQSEYDVR
jgi:hypothetical protein